MDRLHQMAVFVAVAEAGGFAGGARRLQMSAPAVTRAVAALERGLRIKLLTRTTRHVRLTAIGQRYLEDARRILADVQAADDTARGAHAAPLGTLTVTAPVIFGRLFVIPVVAEYLRRHGDTSVCAIFDDRVMSTVEEGMDVSVRIGALPDSGVHAIRVGKVRRVLCASPAYLSTSGTPRTAEDLLQHTLISAASVSPTTEWQFKGQRAVRVKPRLVVSNNDAAIAACTQGLGVARLMSYQVASAIAAGHLQTILHEFEPESLPVHVMYRGGRQAAANIRVFVDIATTRLRAELAQIAEKRAAAPG